MSYERDSQNPAGYRERKKGKEGGMWKWMWMLLSPNKVFCLELRPC